MVLSHPEILLHNNPAELCAKQRVRKHDVSLQTRTSAGIKAWDTFQTLVATANKVGVNVHHYFHDRIAQIHLLPSFADLIEETCQRSLAFGFLVSRNMTYQCFFLFVIIPQSFLTLLPHQISSFSFPELLR